MINRRFALWGVVGAAVIGATTLGIAWADDHKKGDKPVAEIGKAAPDFELKAIDGKTYKLSEHEDKIVVLEWFNLHCPFVRAAAEMMSDTSAKYSKQGVVWLAIDSTHPQARDYEKPEAIGKYAEEHDLDYPILKDEDGKVGKMYGAKTTPHIFIINKGKLVYIGGHAEMKGGAKPGDRNYIAETLDALLAGKDVPQATTPNRGCSVKYGD